MKDWNDNQVKYVADCQIFVCFAISSWCKCFISSCIYCLYGNKLFVMVVGMRIIVIDQQFNLVRDMYTTPKHYIN